MSQHIVAEGTVGKDSIGNGVEARHMEIAHETQPRRVAIVGKQWPKLTYHEPLQTHNNRQGDGSHEPFCRFYRSEEHTSELQSRQYLVCRLLLEKKKNYLYTATS